MQLSSPEYSSNRDAQERARAHNVTVPDFLDQLSNKLELTRKAAELLLGRSLVEAALSRQEQASKSSFVQHWKLRASMSELSTSGWQPSSVFLEPAIVDVSDAVRAVAPKPQITGRLKTAEETTRKSLRYARSARPIHDRVGVRVVVRDVNECFAVAERLRWKMLCIEAFCDDYISSPKPNGYQSLHVAAIASNGFPFEIQVRTHEMHARAERGAAAHHLYKARQAGGTG